MWQKNTTCGQKYLIIKLFIFKLVGYSYKTVNCPLSDHLKYNSCIENCVHLQFTAFTKMTNMA